MLFAELARYLSLIATDFLFNDVQATEDFGLLVRYIEKFSQGNFLDAVVKHFVDRQDFESLFQLPEVLSECFNACIELALFLTFVAR